MDDGKLDELAPNLRRLGNSSPKSRFPPGLPPILTRGAARAGGSVGRHHDPRQSNGCSTPRTTIDQLLDLRNTAPFTRDCISEAMARRRCTPGPRAPGRTAWSATATDRCRADATRRWKKRCLRCKRCLTSSSAKKARLRVHDAMVGKAQSRHVTGGQCFGYRNVDVSAPGRGRTDAPAVRAPAT